MLYYKAVNYQHDAVNVSRLTLADSFYFRFLLDVTNQHAQILQQLQRQTIHLLKTKVLISCDR